MSPEKRERCPKCDSESIYHDSGWCANFCCQQNATVSRLRKGDAMSSLLGGVARPYLPNTRITTLVSVSESSGDRDFLELSDTSDTPAPIKASDIALAAGSGSVYVPVWSTCTPRRWSVAAPSSSSWKSAHPNGCAIASIALPKSTASGKPLATWITTLLCGRVWKTPASLARTSTARRFLRGSSDFCSSSRLTRSASSSRASLRLSCLIASVLVLAVSADFCVSANLASVRSPAIFPATIVSPPRAIVRAVTPSVNTCSAKFQSTSQSASQDQTLAMLALGFVLFVGSVAIVVVAALRALHQKHLRRMKEIMGKEPRDDANKS